METQNQTPPPNTQNDDAAFAKKIEESKIAIQAATAAPPKRGRGRPPKPKPQSSASPDALNSSPGASPSAPVPAPDIAIYLKPPIQMISKIPAVKYQIPELQFSDDEAGACAEALNHMVQAFVPDVNKMDPKTASVVQAFAVFGSIGFQKYSIYRSKRAQLPETQNENEAQNENLELQKNAPISPDAYFSRQTV